MGGERGGVAVVVEVDVVDAVVVEVVVDVVVVVILVVVVCRPRSRATIVAVVLRNVAVVHGPMAA